MAGWQIPLSGAQNNFSQALYNGEAQAQQRQVQAQQLQNAALQGDQAKMQLQEMQQQQQDQENMRKAYMGSGGDMDKFFTAARSAGVRPQSLQPIQENYLKIQKAYGDRDESLNKADAARKEQLNGALMGAFSTVGQDGSRTWNAPDPDQWNSFLNNQAAEGKLTKQEYAYWSQAHPGQNPPNPTELQSYSNTLMTGTQAINAAEKAREQKRLEDQAKSEAALHGAQQQEAEQKVLQGKVADASSFLAGAKNVGDYNSKLSSLDPNIASRFPDFSDYEDSADIDDSDRKVILQRGLTAEQNVTSQKAEAQLQATIDDHKTLRRIEQQQADTSAAFKTAMAAIADRKADRQSPAEHKQQISQLADQAIAESASQGGGKIEDAIANVREPSFYQNHPIGENRGEVLAELQRRKMNGLAQTSREQSIYNKAPVVMENGKLVKQLPDGTKVPVSGSAPVQPPSGAAPATPRSTGKPAPSPSGAGAGGQAPIAVKASDGKTYRFTDPSKAQQFEDAVKAQGGTTERLGK